MEEVSHPTSFFVDTHNPTSRDVGASAETARGSAQHGLTKITQRSWRERKESTGEFSKNPVETAPRNCGLLSVVVVEHVMYN